jgi:putative membrane protein
MGAMRSFILRVIINGLALGVASWLLPGLDISASATTAAVGNSGVTEGTDAIGIILGVVNALVKPVVSLLSLPLTILTLGLFTIVINAAMLYLTSWLSSYTPVHFTIDSFFWTALLAAVIITVISLVAGRLAGRR